MCPSRAALRDSNQHGKLGSLAGIGPAHFDYRFEFWTPLTDCDHNSLALWSQSAIRTASHRKSRARRGNGRVGPGHVLVLRAYPTAVHHCCVIRAVQGSANRAGHIQVQLAKQGNAASLLRPPANPAIRPSDIPPLWRNVRGPSCLIWPLFGSLFGHK
jgi:hypothetical protein